MRNDGERPSIGFLSTYPPTSCGLATFTAALRGAVAGRRGTDDGLGVVSLVDSQLGEQEPEVVHEHLNGDGASLEVAIESLNSFDVAFVQHEYGIFGGPDGSEVLELLAGLEIPAVVTLHTVLSQPSPSQRSILEKVVTLAERTIVMSDTARRRLVNGYRADPAKVRVVPHGARVCLRGASSGRARVWRWRSTPSQAFRTFVLFPAMSFWARPIPRSRLHKATSISMGS